MTRPWYPSGLSPEECGLGFLSSRRATLGVDRGSFAGSVHRRFPYEGLNFCWRCSFQGRVTTWSRCWIRNCSWIIYRAYLVTYNGSPKCSCMWVQDIILKGKTEIQHAERALSLFLDVAKILCSSTSTCLNFHFLHPSFFALLDKISALFTHSPIFKLSFFLWGRGKNIFRSLHTPDCLAFFILNQFPNTPRGTLLFSTSFSF